MDKDIQNLIVGCKKNDRKAQKEFYSLYFSYGMSISLRYLRDEQKAKAALNESFFKFFTKIKKFDVSQEIKPYLKRIIINTSIDIMRKEKKYSETTSLDDQEIPSYADSVLSKIGYSELYKLVQTLSEGYRTVFNMYVIDGFNHKEIAFQLGISEGTSKSNLSRAKSILQKRITHLVKAEDGRF